MKVVLSQDPLEPERLLQEALLTQQSAAGGAGGRVGALVSFTGLVRGEDGRVQGLELEAYAGFAETAISEAAAGAMARFDLIDLLIAHRIGRVPVGDAVVFVAAAATHRRAAFLGADYMMDYLKSQAPFWKKSIETGGARWITPRSEDYRDAARWDTEETL